MTTLVWTGEVLAADSKGSMGGGSNLGDMQKIFTPGEGEYWDVQGVRVLAFALAGQADNAPFVKEALLAGVTHRTDVDWFDLDFLALLVDENKTCWYWGQSRNAKTDIITLNPITGPITGGSGSKFATAVLAVGGSAEDAVKTAIRLDNGSGGSVSTWVHPGVPEVPSKRPVVAKAPELPKTLDEFNAAIKKAAQEAVQEAMAKPVEPIFKEAVLAEIKPKAETQKVVKEANQTVKETDKLIKKNKQKEVA